MRRTFRLLAGPVIAAVVAHPAAAPAAALPAPRVTDLKPRVFDLKKRVVDRKPKSERKSFAVDSDILFDFDSAKVSDDGKATLDDVAANLRKRKSGKVTIVGATPTRSVPPATTVTCPSGARRPCGRTWRARTAARP